MRSRASIKSHPLHPILIVFPAAFFTGTLVFDLLAAIYDRLDFMIAAYYMEIAGIAGGVLAAVPGVIDYFFTIPPKSSAKKRGAAHGLLNATALVIFTAVWIYRHNLNVSLTLIIILEVIGATLLAFAAWMGGTLVYRNQIGVDPRYANAGKWKEVFIDAGSGPVEVAREDELQENQMKLIHYNGRRIVLGRTARGYVAFSDHCPHKGGSLAGGAMMCGTVQCPWHGSQFDVATGALAAGPAQEGIPTYTVQVTNGRVLLTGVPND